jgi:hypothetical protein
MTVDISPIKCYIREEFLINESSEEYLHGEIIGISSYEHCLPTFQVLIDNSFLYSDVPLSELTHKKDVKTKPLTDTCHIKCPSFDIDVFKHEIFKNRCISFYDIPCMVYKKGVYLLSVDFYTDNEMIHLIKGDDGYFYFAPNHKINWSGKSFLPKYKKK